MNNDTQTGVLASAVTVVAWLLGLLVKHKEELQAASFAVSFVVGLFAIAWWIRRFWRVSQGKKDSGD